VDHQTISIERPFTAFTDVLQPLFSGLRVDTTEENIQARCRGILLMAVSNKTGRMVLATGNKSEMSVGYATLYGDMAGGFAPLKDVFKTTVYDIARWLNREAQVIPERTISRAPTAELRENQKDEDSLPPYEILDPILERYVELDQQPEEIIAAGFDADTVRRVAMMVDHNEYKRRQAPPGVKISQRAFGRDRRYPITSRYRET
jgi:NAD+ synthase (glutamine-hydrolysing)